MKIAIPANVYKRMKAYVMAVNSEISMLGKVEKNGNDFTITDLALFEQIVSAGETTLDMLAIGKFYDEMVQRGEDTLKWRAWIHSHYTMPTFFSGVDEATINDFDMEVPADNWMLSIVTNQEGAIKTRLDLFAPVRFTIVDLPLDIDFTNVGEDVSVAEEVKLKVTPKIERWRKPKQTSWKPTKEELSEIFAQQEKNRQLVLAKLE